MPVSKFYVLPPRLYLGQCFARYLEGLFPGLKWEPDLWMNLAEGLTSAAACQPGVYLVHREELPEGEDPAQALRDGFGAEPGDEIIELRTAGRPGEWAIQHSRVGAA
jgi:hypothetical protein